MAASPFRTRCGSPRTSPAVRQWRTCLPPLLEAAFLLGRPDKYDLAHQICQKLSGPDGRGLHHPPGRRASLAIGSLVGTDCRGRRELVAVVETILRAPSGCREAPPVGSLRRGQVPLSHPHRDAPPARVATVALRSLLDSRYCRIEGRNVMTVQASRDSTEIFATEWEAWHRNAGA